MLKIKEVAEQLGFSENCIRAWIKSGRIKAVKIFYEWRIPQEEVDRIKKGDNQ